jgi:DNA segregation ATPase FtsK/SpoIIIE, S-DNA-T family
MAVITDRVGRAALMIETAHAGKHLQGAMIEQTLASKLSALGIQGEIVGIQKGPVLSTLLFRPAIATRVGTLVRATEDLSLALGGRVRLLPDFESGCVAIVVPHQHRQTVAWLDLICKVLDAPGALPLPLGVDVYGSLLVADLAEMPHLLIAGSSGSGKSTALHSIILSLLSRNACHQLWFVMIDPKGVELAPYAGRNGGKGLPHTWSFAVTYDEAVNALSNVCLEVERRYQLMAKHGLRSVQELGLPRIVVVIDELADLMVQGKKQVEAIIARIAQKARAAGVHLIIATQRPSVNIISGVIKANLPARLCLRLPSSHDSRTVIDVAGAEKLLGAGDGLYVGPGFDLTRVHCPLVTQANIQQMVAEAKWPISRMRAFWQRLWTTESSHAAA